MKLKTCSNSINPCTSFFNFTVRKNIGFAALAAAFALFISPYFLSRTISNSLEYSKEEFYVADALFRGVEIAALICGMLFFLLLILINFKYLNSKSSVDFFGALPLTRNEMFISRFFGTYICSLLPVTAAYIGLWILSTFKTVQINSTPILLPYFYTILCILAIGFFGMVFMVSCGNLFDAVFSFLAVNAGLIFVFVIINDACDLFLMGYSDTSIIIKACPLVAFTEKLYEMFGINPTFTVSDIIKTVIFAAVFFIVSLKLYKIRKNEKAKEPYAFAYLKYIVIGIAAQVGYVVFGAIFADGYNSASLGSVFNAQVIFVGIIGGALFAIIAGAIVNRGFYNLKKAVIPSVAAVLLVYAIYGLTALDITGYEKRVPKTDDVQKVTMSVMHNSFPVDDVQQVIDFHKSVVKNGDADNLYDDSDSKFIAYSVQIDYNLKNGKKLTRSYNLDSFSAESEMCNKILTENIGKKYLDELDKTDNKIFSLGLSRYENDENYNAFGLSKEEVRKIITMYSEEFKTVDYINDRDLFNTNIYIYGDDYKKYTDNFQLSLSLDDSKSELVQYILGLPSIEKAEIEK